MNNNNKPVFFENLDALRFISFLVVFLYHVRLYEYVLSLTDSVIVQSAVRLLCSGGWGVTFFFVLSGFLITWLLLLEYQKNGRISVKAFYLRRIFRIWPLYYAVLIIGIWVLPLLYHLLHKPVFLDYNLWLFGTFFSNFGVLLLDKTYETVRSFPLVLNISWSVSIEEQFYLIWPLFFSSLPVRLWKFVFPLFILVSLIAAGIYSPSYKIVYYNTFIRMGEIAIGGWLAYAYFYQQRFKSFIDNMPVWLLALVYIIPHLLILGTFYIPHGTFGGYMIRMVVCLFFGLIIMEQNFANRSFFKFGRLKLPSKLGKISYGLYMLHPIVLFFTNVIIEGYIKSELLRTPVYIITTFALTLLVAYISYNWFEKQFLVLKARFSKL